jgi:hypothetical protein
MTDGKSQFIRPHTVPQSAHFPRWHDGDFEETERRSGADSETNGLPNYDFVTYRRACPKTDIG